MRPNTNRRWRTCWVNRCFSIDVISFGMYQMTPNWWGRNEPELRSLYEWIELNTHHGGGVDRRGGILGAILGSTWGLVGGSIGFLAGALQVNPAISVAFPVATGVLISLAGVIWFIRGRSEADKTALRSYQEMRGFLWKLVAARWQGDLKELLGAEAAQGAERGRLRIPPLPQCVEFAGLAGGGKRLGLGPDPGQDEGGDGCGDVTARHDDRSRDSARGCERGGPDRGHAKDRRRSERHRRAPG